MNDFDLDALVARVASVSDAEVDALALVDVEADLCDAIMSTAVEPVGAQVQESIRDAGRARHRNRADQPEGYLEENSTDDHRPARYRRLSLRRVGALVAAAALIIGAAVVFGGGSKNRSAWAVRAVAVAEASPRVLVTGDRWKITDVPGFEEAYGEVTFSDGHAVVELFWRPGRTHEGYLNDRAHDGVSLGTTQVAGHDAQVFAMTTTDGSPTGEFDVLWKSDDNSVELRVVGVKTKPALEALLKRVREVDVDTWLSAMPPSVVKPLDRADAVDEMLADIPVPKGFDVDELRSGDKPGLGRGDLGFFVTRAVGCSWLKQWLAATDSGDGAAAKEAAEAMRTSRHWAILKEMKAIGGWLPTRVQQIWDFADALERGFAFDGAGLKHSVREVYAPDGRCLVAI